MKRFLKNLFILSIFLIFFDCSNKTEVDLPKESYKKEIEKLNPKDYSNYWKKLLDFDQNILMNEKDYKVYDSLSFVTLIKSALFYEIKGDSIFNVSNFENEIFFIHHHIPRSNLDFWPLLMKQKEIKGKLLMFPSYQLEGVAYSFFGYSVLRQDSIYDKLISKIKAPTDKKVSDALIDSYLDTKKINKLSIKSVLGSWRRKTYKNEPFNPKSGSFELLTLSDGNYYLRYNKTRFKPLDVIKKTKDEFIFKTKCEPFGWYFKLNSVGDLALYNEKDILLIAYEKSKF